MPLGSGTIPSFVAARAASTPRAPAAFYRRRGRWRKATLADLLRASEELAAAFVRLGLESQDRLAIMCRTRIEWLVAELAAMASGIVVVGIDAHAATSHIAFILEDSGARALIVDHPEALARVDPDVRARLKLIVAIDRAPAEGETVQRLQYWDELVSAFSRRWRRGAKRSAQRRKTDLGVSAGRRDQELSAPIADTPATLLYTSGTTGMPKGILYRQRHLAAACRSILDEFPVIANSGGSTICWLPMAALLQRMMNYVALASGVAIYFVEDPATVVAVAKKVQPTYFIGVPRFFEKVYQGIHQKLAARPRYVQRLVDLALARSPRVTGAKVGIRRRIEWRILDALVLKRLRGVLGGRLRFMITGSAPTPPWLLEYFDRLGILLLEAYGLSECTIPIAANRPDAYRFGSVGRVFAMNDVRIADDGEILVRGPGMFEGYMGHGNIASGNFTAEGFYRTGDLGVVDAENFLFVTGRKSEVFKTSTGRWVAPARVEAVYKKIPYIEQIIVLGRGQRYPVALLTINGLLLAAILKRRKVAHPEVAGPDNFGGQPAVHSQIAADFEALGTELNAYERIRRFRVLPGLFTLEGGELTPSLKLKREVIAAKYHEIIEGLYEETA